MKNLKVRYSEYKTKKIRIGDKYIGGSNPILVQSMTNTDTRDIKGTIRQIKELESVGCDLIRVAVIDEQAARALSKIKSEIKIPLIADIHFNPQLAILAIENGADKIRLNPGNIKKMDDWCHIINVAKDYDIPLRIGMNSGCMPSTDNINASIADRMVDSAMEYCKLIEKLDYNNIVLAVKSSDIEETIESYRKLSRICTYPLHIGITETGIKESGIIKSSIGIGTLLAEGIGDTIRVSLTGDPIDEVKVGVEILKSMKLKKRTVEIISCPTCGRTRTNVIDVVNALKEHIEHYDKEMSVAIMGCAVNGPGEAKRADIGVAGGVGEYLYFEHGVPIEKIPSDNIISFLLHKIDEY